MRYTIKAEKTCSNCIYCNIANECTNRYSDNYSENVDDNNKCDSWREE